MRKLLVLTVLLTCLGTAAWALSIFDIQYTANPGIDNTYPSQYVGRTVSVEGVVTATGYRGNGFILSETAGGPYRAIMVMERRNSVQVGDYIRISAKVSESFGMTCLEDVSAIRILDRNYPLPQPMMISTGQISSADESEAYEGVLVKVQNVSAASARASRGRFMVTDGSGQCPVVINSFSNLNINPSAGTIFSYIQGIIVFAHSEYSLNPVSSNSFSLAAPVYNQSRSWGRIKSIYR
ncbi:MAG: hypothetical protein CVU49_02420 [Candidatus Cloacimonetes bacterium HGW-Cloacimonetes-2]|jgi:hypothetical protein|nr:MAG: hypothetical protein CVU49_02420 [Candidatus Cloacimonetes bacterium HGW-Cloacimonetes-2]